MRYSIRCTGRADLGLLVVITSGACVAVACLRLRISRVVITCAMISSVAGGEDLPRRVIHCVRLACRAAADLARVADRTAVPAPAVLDVGIRRGIELVEHAEVHPITPDQLVAGQRDVVFRRRAQPDRRHWHHVRLHALEIARDRRVQQSERAADPRSQRERVQQHERRRR